MYTYRNTSNEPNLFDNYSCRIDQVLRGKSVDSVAFGFSFMKNQIQIKCDLCYRSRWKETWTGCELHTNEIKMDKMINIPLRQFMFIFCGQFIDARYQFIGVGRQNWNSPRDICANMQKPLKHCEIEAISKLKYYLLWWLVLQIVFQLFFSSVWLFIKKVCMCRPIILRSQQNIERSRCRSLIYRLLFIRMI